MTKQKQSLLTLYKASAGSGKTFTLAVRYIAMVVREPSDYRHILAVTFTNKATAEMKQRILSQLYGIGNGLPESSSYLEKVKEFLPDNFSDNSIKVNALKALNFILNDYSHFRIETIDSFFQRVLNGLARELQLGSGLALELDTDSVISDAVDTFLAELKPGTRENNDVVQYVIENIENDSNWHIESKIKDFSKQLFQENFLEKGDSLRTYLQQAESIANYRKELNKCKDQMDAIAEEHCNCGKQIQKLIDDNPDYGSYVASNPSKLFAQIAKGDFLEKKAKMGKTIDSCIENGAETILKKAGLTKLGNAYTLSDIIVDWLQKAKESYANYTYINNSYSVAKRYLNELSLLLAIRKEITIQNSEQDRFVLADTPHLLSQLEEGDTSFVFENTGSFTKHIMIDEFQDTSRLQWKNLRLLLMECLSQNKECLVVGDVKQSIYRWRNGDWKILNTGIEKDLSVYNPETVTLNTNFRSLNKIIEFNNLFFPIAQSYLSDIYKGTFTIEHPNICGAYSDVCQKSNKKENNGYICLELHNNNKIDDEALLMPGIIALHLDQLTNAGVNQSDITILTRTNKDISQICSWFAENRPEYRMVSDEAFYMETSPAMRIIISAMRYISNSTDNISLAALAIEWNQYVNNKPITFDALLPESIISNIPSAYLESVERLTHLPLYEMAEELYRILEIDRIENQDAYLFSFFDRIRLFTQKKSNSLSLFIEEWDNILHRKPIAMGNTDSIRLMTIHKSKGLEFHTVILPYCNWLIESKSKLWVEPKREPFNKLPLLPIDCTATLKESVFSEDYQDEYGDTLVDNLNLLYVAFTRAVANLIVLGQTKSKRNGFSTYDILTYFAEGQTETTHNEHITSYTTGNIMPGEKREREKESKNPLTTVKESQTINMCHYPMSTQFKQSTESMRYMSDNTQESNKTESYIEKGKLLHRLFSTINTVKDIDRETDRMLAEGLFDSAKSAESIKQFIHKAIDKPEVKEWFDGNYKLLNETSILFRDNGTTQKRIPDRVMINGNKAIVVDFKFGKEYEGYMHQVQEYISLLRQMGFTHVDGYIWYVYSNKTIKC